MTVLKILQCDITEVHADAIVNAANENLILGSGVAGAIRHKGGPLIQEECNRLSPIPTGTSVVTSAGEMPYKAIIHAVAPDITMSDWKILLASAVRDSILKADCLGLKSVALPALGTGIFSLPLKDAAFIMISEARKTALMCRKLDEIIFCLYGSEAFNVFREYVAGH